MSVTNIHGNILIEQLVQDNTNKAVTYCVIFERYYMDHYDNCESRLENNP